MKICRTCTLEKPKLEFQKMSSSPDGLQPKCRACSAAYDKENAERISARKRAYYEKKKQEILDRQTAYRASNKNSISARMRKYYSENKEAYAVRGKDRRENNPEACSAHNRARRARKAMAEGTHTAAEVRAIFDAQQGLCANCHMQLLKSGPNKYHVDHVMPIKLGGSNDKSNLQCLCKTCNLSKNAKDPIIWANENGRLL